VPPRLFVYGTLQPDRLRWPLLEPFATGHRPATVPGALYDSGNGWPVADFADRYHDVPGALVDLDPATLDDAFALLDDIEGTVAGLLQRIVVTTTDGVEAWSYHWPGPTIAMRRVARWDAVEEQ
jgi:gamma-glutamylcyclotransferase (GGCT)/AIG2-like uncharacterized protein YtfP